MLTGVFAATGFPPLPGTISISCVSGFWSFLSESSVFGAARPPVRDVTPPNASLKELRFFGLVTGNLPPRFPILLHIRRTVAKPVFITRQGSDARCKQRKLIEKLFCFSGKPFALVPSRKEDAGVKLPFDSLH